MRKLKTALFFLAATIWYACGSGGKGNTLSADYTAFKIEDTASIDRIVLSNRSNQQTVLVRNTNRWDVENGNFPARKDLVEVTLNTLRRMEVKEFVSKAGRDHQLKQLAVHGTKVEVYQNGEITRRFYVGGPTQNHMGTYMMLDGADMPVVVYVPGFRGYLSNHFTPNIQEWKSRQIFAYHISDIQSVKVKHVRNPEQSFKVEVLSPLQFALFRGPSLSQNMPSFDTSLVKVFLQNFKALGFENFVDVNAARMDSVRAGYGLYSVEVLDKEGTLRKVDLYQIPLPPGTLNMLGEPVNFDVDRMYGVVDDSIITLCQFFTFDPVTMPADYFLKKSVVDGETDS